MRAKHLYQVRTEVSQNRFCLRAKHTPLRQLSRNFDKLAFYQTTLSPRFRLVQYRARGYQTRSR